MPHRPREVPQTAARAIDAAPDTVARLVERASDMRLTRLSGPALLAVVTVAYLALAQFVIWLNDPVRLGAGFWPAAGFSLALLLLLPERMWPWVVAGVAIAEIGGDLFHGYPPAAVVLWTLG